MSYRFPAAPERDESLGRCEQVIAEHRDAYLRVRNTLDAVRTQQLGRDRYGSFGNFLAQTVNLDWMDDLSLADEAPAVRQALLLQSRDPDHAVAAGPGSDADAAAGAGLGA